MPSRYRSEAVHIPSTIR